LNSGVVDWWERERLALFVCLVNKVRVYSSIKFNVSFFKLATISISTLFAIAATPVFGHHQVHHGRWLFRNAALFVSITPDAPGGNVNNLNLIVTKLPSWP
jgi:hypothetical protein